MQKLYPIATKETRHLFISPAIYQEWSICKEVYGKGQTSYLKPGKVPNLMALCMPKDVRYSITEEPDPGTMAVDSIIYGLRDKEGFWHVCTAENLNIKLTQESVGNHVLNGHITIPAHRIFPNTDHDVDFGDEPILVPIDLHYARATRCLQISTSGTYDNGKAELYGITLNLDHKDSKIVR